MTAKYINKFFPFFLPLFRIVGGDTKTEIHSLKFQWKEYNISAPLNLLLVLFIVMAWNEHVVHLNESLGKDFLLLFLYTDLSGLILYVTLSP
jgi:hypothetical protein